MKTIRSIHWDYEMCLSSARMFKSIYICRHDLRCGPRILHVCTFGVLCHLLRLTLLHKVFCTRNSWNCVAIERGLCAKIFVKIHHITSSHYIFHRKIDTTYGLKKHNKWMTNSYRWVSTRSRNSIAYALELRISCTNLSIYSWESSNIPKHDK